MQTVYFDYNATTPLDPQVREAMLPFLGEVWGNPSSVHHVGRQARASWTRRASALQRSWAANPAKSSSPAAEPKAPTWRSWAPRGS